MISGIFIKDRADRGELSVVYFTKHLMLADYLKNPLQGALFHKFRDILVGRVSTFTLLEGTFLYTRKERVVKHIPSKDIPSGNGEPLKETKDMLEYENDKQVRTSTVEPLKDKEMLREENDKRVRTSTGEPLKEREMFRDKNGKQVRTYADVVSTGKIRNKRE